MIELFCFTVTFKGRIVINENASNGELCVFHFENGFFFSCFMQNFFGQYISYPFPYVFLLFLSDNTRYIYNAFMS